MKDVLRANLFIFIRLSHIVHFRYGCMLKEKIHLGMTENRVSQSQYKKPYLRDRKSEEENTDGSILQ